MACLKRRVSGSGSWPLRAWQALAGPLIAVLGIATPDGPAAARDVQVHMGLTAAEFAAFVARAGWAIDGAPDAAGRRIAFRATAPGDRPVVVRVRLDDCDAGNRCNVAEVQTYFVFSPAAEARQAVYDWNVAGRTESARGVGLLACATSGFYVHLRQALYLRGVTDLYLREALVGLWARNATAFAGQLEARRQRK